MIDQGPNPQNPYPDPSSGSSESQSESPNSSGMINRSNDPANNNQPTEHESREQEQKFTMVGSENQPTPSTTSQSDISSNETATIPETWLGKEEADDLRTRWKAIQFQFVDSPCSAVEQGDTLVAEAIERITQSLSNIQNILNQQWVNHDDITTEELRQTLQNYRTVLDRLLAQ